MHDVVSGERADRNEANFNRAAGIGCDLIEYGSEVLLDGAEGRFVVADQIHLVHCNQNVAHAQQRCNVRMAARLDQYAFAGVDQHHRRIGRGRAGGHVARVLLMARRIRNDELARALRSSDRPHR